MLLSPPEGISEPLIMDYLPLAQILYRIAHVRVVDEAEDVIVGHASLLLC